jgi:dihydroorotate dehydrogenase electron transfer subunit
MRLEIAQVASIGLYDALPDFYRLRLRAPAIAASIKPGRFVRINIETDYVPRPFFPIELEDEGFSLLLPPGNPLRRLQPGDELECVGPRGKGFKLPPTAQNLLLLAQSSGFGLAEQQNGVTFLLTLIDQALAAKRNVFLLHEAPSAAQLFLPQGLPPDVEVRLFTADGSLGQKGAALDALPELAQWADQVYAVGALEWYTALVRGLEEHRLRVRDNLAWGLAAQEIMPCGAGVCGGCAIETRRGYRLCCTQGPVFDLYREFR